MLDTVLLFRDALYGALVIGITCAVLGVYVVLRRIVFVGAALAQLSSAGIALALWLTGFTLTAPLGHYPTVLSLVVTLLGVGAAWSGEESQWAERAGAMGARAGTALIGVIGVAGDGVEIRGKKVYINGKQIEDPHAHFEGDDPQSILPASRDDFGPTKVPENHVFVMGDNRNSSRDSRDYGAISGDHIMAKVIFRWWPPQSIGSLAN